jgi:twitching motility protein PilT
LTVRSALERARELRASDVHLDPIEGVAVRIFSRIERLAGAKIDAAGTESFVTEAFDSLARARLDKLGTADSTYVDPQIGGVRIHASRSRGGVRLALRLLPIELPALHSLMLPKAVAVLGDSRSGFVVVAAPSGNGKTTTVIALLARLCEKSAHHIVTIERLTEHPMRWQTSIVTQYEVGRDVATFADGVRGAMRADPDVIFVGELADADTLEASLEAAEAGHLVFSTLAAPPETPQVLGRLVALFSTDDQERARSRIADALRGIVGLRLVPVREGSSSRAAAEILLVNETVRRIIREGAFHQTRSQLSRHARDGMRTLELSLSDLVAEGAIDLAAARAVSQYPDEISLPSQAALRC